MSDAHDRKWLVLTVVGAAFFMTILDVAIVNVAIPSIQNDLKIAESTVQWVFFVNVPVGAIVLALTRPIVPESRADLGHRRFDAVGAVSVTGGLALLVYAISKAPDVGWATGRTIGFLIAAVVVLAVFVG